jgi:nitroreductase
MELYDAMRTLRAVRRLRPDPIPNDVLDRVLEAATWAPTGGNVQPWRMVVVTNPDLQRQLGDLYRGEWDRYLGDRDAGLSRFEGEDRAQRERTLAAGDYLGAHWYEAPATLVFCFNPGQMAITDAGLDRPSVVGGGSVYTAVQNAMLAARAEGLGCVLTTLLCYREEEVRALLDMPADWYTCAHVPLGYPVGRGHGSIARLPVGDLAYADRWGSSYA